MSRHRNIRNIDYAEERDDYDDDFGRSVEEDMCVSPSTEQSFMYGRQRPVNELSSYFAGQSLQSSLIPPSSELDELTETQKGADLKELLAGLSEHDRALLMSCVDYVRNIVGDEYSDEDFIEAAILAEFDTEKCAQLLLNGNVSSSRVITNNQTNRPLLGLTEGFSCTNLEKLQHSSQSKPLPKVGSTKHITVGNTKPAVTKAKLKTSIAPIDTANNANDLAEQRSSTTTSPLPGASPRRPPSKKQTTASIEQRRARVAEEQQRRLEKPVINLVVVGHVDAGKSTLMGHLLYLLKEIDDKTMRKTEHEARKVGKQSFSFAWALDETEEERTRGITMDVAHAKFDTSNRRINVLDAPGHKDFIPNMISGAAQADRAIVVVDATTGEFESGFDLGGQTREHVVLLRSLGVQELIVAVNKMDNVSWSRERFDDIVGKLSAFLKQTGFRGEEIAYIPVSGLDGANLIVKSPHLNWFDGPTLVERIDEFKVPPRLIDKPLRLAVMDTFRSTFGSSDTCVAGRVLQGVLHAAGAAGAGGDTVLIQPAGEFATVKAIFIDGEPSDVALAGDYITLSLIEVDAAHITVGSVLCDADHPCRAATTFRARIAVFTPKVPITKSIPVILFQQTSQESATIKKILVQLDKKTGEVEKQRPRVLPRGSTGEIEIATARPVCVELFSESRELGRFTLRSEGDTIAAGIVTAIC